MKIEQILCFVIEGSVVNRGVLFAPFLAPVRVSLVDDNHGHTLPVVEKTGPSFPRDWVMNHMVLEAPIHHQQRIHIPQVNVLQNPADHVGDEHRHPVIHNKKYNQ